MASNIDNLQKKVRPLTESIFLDRFSLFAVSWLVVASINTKIGSEHRLPTEQIEFLNLVVK